MLSRVVHAFDRFFFASYAGYPLRTMTHHRTPDVHSVSYEGAKAFSRCSQKSLARSSIAVTIIVWVLFLLATGCTDQSATKQPTLPASSTSPAASGDAAANSDRREQIPQEVRAETESGSLNELSETLAWSATPDPAQEPHDKSWSATWSATISEPYRLVLPDRAGPVFALFQQIKPFDYSAILISSRTEKPSPQFGGRTFNQQDSPFHPTARV